MKQNRKTEKVKSRLKQLLLTFIVILGFGFNSGAQEITVSGTVTSSEDNMPIPGVAIIVKGTSKGAVTDFDGNYTINANTGDILLFTYLGMEDTSETVKGAQLNVVMDPAVEGLEEVIVVGYGQQKKKEIIGAVARIKAEDIEDDVVVDLGTRLQGKVTGVNVTNAGQIGQPAEIIIRGIPSLFSSVTPLFVVDGIPQDNNPLIPPNEIETIDVLKDAASAAVYGSRGANGVILITTKRGKAGAAKITYSTSMGIRNVTNELDLLNARETFLAENLSFGPSSFIGNNQPNFRNVSQTGYFNDTSLLDFIIQDNALTTTHDLSLSGGSEKFIYSVSGGFVSGEGVFRGSEEFDRYNLRVNTTYNGDKFRLRVGVGYRSELGERSSSQGFSRGLNYSPLLAEITDNTTTFEIDSESIASQINEANNTANNINLRRREHDDRFNTNIGLSFDLAKNLTFNSNIGFAVRNRRTRVVRPVSTLFNVDTQQIESTSGSLLQMADERTREFSGDGSLVYKFGFGKSNFTLTGVLTYEDRIFESFTARATDFISEDVLSFANTSGDQLVTDGFVLSANNFLPEFTDNRTERITGALARLQYNFDDRYLFSALVRRDGSSKFSKSERIGYFPSASVGWNVSNEAFWSGLKNVVRNFKIRASFGTTGNDRVPQEDSRDLAFPLGSYIVDTTEEGTNGAILVRDIPNPDLKWETTIQKNIGVDLGFFKNRLNITADYYITEKEDLVFQRVLPSSAGANSSSPPASFLFNRTFQNFADLENEGYEISVRYKSAKNRNFSWDATVNYSANQSEVTNIPTDATGEAERFLLTTQTISGQGLNRGFLNSYVTFLEEGRPAGALFVYRTDGAINDADELADYIARFPNGNFVQAGNRSPRIGDIKILDANGDGILDEDDKQFVGSTLPDFDLSLDLNFNYKNWGLSMLWYGAFGSKIYNGAAATQFLNGRSRDLLNQFDAVLNPDSEIPSRGHFNSSRGNPNNLGSTDRYLEDGDFLRLRNIRLNYSFPKDVLEKIGISKLGLFASATNVLTFTKYSGLDPELSGDIDSRNPIATKGIDRGRSPVTSLFSMGLNVQF